MTKPALLTTEDDWRSVLDTNLDGAFRVARAAAQAMADAKRGGAIVNIASILGFRASRSSSPAYIAAKAALLKLSEAMALEWAPHGIRVNALAPGYIETELNRDFLRSPAGESLVNASHCAASARRPISTGRCCCWSAVPAGYDRRHGHGRRRALARVAVTTCARGPGVTRHPRATRPLPRCRSSPRLPASPDTGVDVVAGGRRRARAGDRGRTRSGVRVRRAFLRDHLQTTRCAAGLARAARAAPPRPRRARRARGRDAGRSRSRRRPPSAPRLLPVAPARRRRCPPLDQPLTGRIVEPHHRRGSATCAGRPSHTVTIGSAQRRGAHRAPRRKTDARAGPGANAVTELVRPVATITAARHGFKLREAAAAARRRRRARVHWSPPARRAR